MKAAFSFLDNRIAPVFDVSGQIRVIETGPGAEIFSDQREFLPEGLPVQRALRLVDLGVEILVCGAISRPLQETLMSYGIKVFPFLTGTLEEVIQAWISGGLDNESFMMPGCYGHGRGRYRSMRRNSVGFEMAGGGGMGRGGGGGKGTGTGRGRGGGQGLGRMGGSSAGGVGGDCVCPKCGHRLSHERGVPCFERDCPKCGAKMARA